jgi:hypothetical protein
LVGLCSMLLFAFLVYWILAFTRCSSFTLNVVTINLNPDEDKDLLTDEEKKDLKQTIEKLKTNSFEGRNSIQTNA